MTEDERKAWVHDLLMEDSGRMIDPHEWASVAFASLVLFIMNPYNDQAQRDKAFAILISKAPQDVAIDGTYMYTHTNKEFDL